MKKVEFKVRDGLWDSVLNWTNDRIDGVSFLRVDDEVEQPILDFTIQIMNIIEDRIWEL